MDDFKRRTRIRKIIYSPFTVSALLILIFFVGHATIKTLETYLETRENYKAALGEFEKLENRKENIENRIEMLSTERGIEEEIRNKFGFIKEGEEVVIIVEPPNSLDNPQKQKEEKETKDSVIKNIFESILNIFR
ncbi:MAG: septum formation initiator family protein [Parcubacteria group bacterium]|nr:septum formation initiator family protein [Parcubacteria group bacterium]